MMNVLFIVFVVERWIYESMMQLPARRSNLDFAARYIVGSTYRDGRRGATRRMERQPYGQAQTIQVVR